MILQKEQSFMKYLFEQSKWNPKSKCNKFVFRDCGIWNSEGINTQLLQSNSKGNNFDKPNNNLDKSNSKQLFNGDTQILKPLKSIKHCLYAAVMLCLLML